MGNVIKNEFTKEIAGQVDTNIRRYNITITLSYNSQNISKQQHSFMTRHFRTFELYTINPIN